MMTTYSDQGRWRYRATVNLPTGKTVRISGTPEINSKEAAELAQEEGIREAHGEVVTYAVEAKPMESDESTTLSKNMKGSLAEMYVTFKLIEAGYGVSIPVGVLRYDLIVETSDGQLKKVQVKTGRVESNGGIAFNAYSIAHRTETEKAKRRDYSMTEVDYFAVYVPVLKKAFLIKNQDVMPRAFRPEEAALITDSVFEGAATLLAA